MPAPKATTVPDDEELAAPVTRAEFEVFKARAILADVTLQHEIRAQSASPRVDWEGRRRVDDVERKVMLVAIVAACAYVGVLICFGRLPKQGKK